MSFVSSAARSLLVSVSVIIVAASVTACGSSEGSSGAVVAATAPSAAAATANTDTTPDVAINASTKTNTTVAASTQVVATPAGQTQAAPSTSSSLTVDWSTLNADGTAVSVANMTGYKIRYGTRGDYLDHQVTVNNAGLLTYVIGNLAPATYYVQVSAVDSSGKESSLANVSSLITQ